MFTFVGKLFDLNRNNKKGEVLSKEQKIVTYVLNTKDTFDNA